MEEGSFEDLSLAMTPLYLIFTLLSELSRKGNERFEGIKYAIRARRTSSDSGGTDTDGKLMTSKDGFSCSEQLQAPTLSKQQSQIPLQPVPTNAPTAVPAKARTARGSNGDVLLF